MSAEGPSEPVDVPEPEAPVAAPQAPEPVADAAAPKPEAAPVTVEAPDAQNPKPVAAPRLPVIKTKEDMARAQMRTRVDELDRDILDFQEQIDKEEDTGKQAKMRDKLAEKVGKRDEAYAEYKEAIKELDAKITKIKQELAKIDALKKDIGTLKAFIEANKGTLDKTKITELAGKTRALDDKESELKKLAPKDREADLRATLAVYTAERLRITEDAERRDEIGEADRTLAREMALALGETPPDEPAKLDEAAVKGEAPLTAEQKELILDNKIDQIAFDLAKLLATNVPAENDTFGRYGFEAKRGLLMVLSYFGGDPAWANQLSPEEQKSLGMTVLTKAGADGKTITSIKWEALNFSLNKIQKVYEVAFGKDGWAKEMGELKPTTKLSELQARVDKIPADSKVESDLALKKFVETLKSLGAVPESGVQDFIATNADKILKVYNPESPAPTAGAQTPEGKEIGLKELGDIIRTNKFNETTKMPAVLKAIDPKILPVESLDTEKIPGAAKAQVEAFTTAPAIQAFSDSFNAASKGLVSLGVPGEMSPSLAPALASALIEIQKGPLTSETTSKLQTGIEAYFTIMQTLNDKTLKVFLEEQKDGADDARKKEIEETLTALKPVPAATPPAAPEEPAK